MNKVKQILKSIWPVFAGFWFVVILSTLTDTALELTGIFPALGSGMFITWMLVLALIYRLIFTMIGGYITARLAPNETKLKHLYILMSIGVVLGTLGIIAGWNMNARWYAILLAVLSVGATWVGGTYYLKNR